MNKTVTIDHSHAARCRCNRRCARGGRRRAAAIRSRCSTCRTARRAQSLLAVHGILDTKLPPTGACDLRSRRRLDQLPAARRYLRRAHVTVVDIDEDQIRNNDYAQETILGDIQTYRFPPGSFDLVICYNVIEHLADVEAALLGFCEALKQGGLILIGAPNPKSLSGVVTKYSPHWFHVWFYRYVRGEKTGRPARPAAVPDLLPPAGCAFESRGLRQYPRPSDDLPETI